MTSNLIDKVNASDVGEFRDKLESPPTIVEELLLTQKDLAEYNIVNLAACQAVWLRHILIDYE
jgi:hypothetical protein